MSCPPIGISSNAAQQSGRNNPGFGIVAPLLPESRRGFPTAAPQINFYAPGAQLRPPICRLRFGERPHITSV